MALSLFTVGAKITATALNLMVTAINGSSLTAIVPTSVAGAGVSVGASGKVTFAAATTVSVNGVFTSLYDNYLILWDHPTRSASDGALRLRLAGVDAAGAATYGSQRTWGTASATTTANNSTTSWSVDTASAAAAAGASGEIRMLGPALATTTRGFISWHNASSTTVMYAGTGSLYHSAATAYDGFSFILPAGTMTGSLRIYGYNNN